MALSEAVKEAICLRRSLIEFGLEKTAKTTLFCDSNGARMLAENPVHHNRSKHIDAKHHFVRDAVYRNKLTIKYVPTDEVAADAAAAGISISRTNVEADVGPRRADPEAQRLTDVLGDVDDLLARAARTRDGIRRRLTGSG